MSRKNARELVLHMIFAGEYTGYDSDEIIGSFLDEEAFESLNGEYELYQKMPSESQNEYIVGAVEGVTQKKQELDAYIKKYSVGWDINRLSRITRCVLRLSMFEMKYLDIPVGASVNEALELAKKYDSDEAAAFINGLLSSFIKNELAQPGAAAQTGEASQEPSS